MGVSWSRRPVEALPPRGLRLIMDDGTGRVVPCGVLREPSYDRRGVPAWLVVPLEPVGPLGRTHGGFYVDADDTPAAALLILDISAGRGHADDL
jgi:hypothetical protein